MEEYSLNDTIVAISTPVAVGGIGMVRLSGKDALLVADKVFRPVGTKRISDTAGYHGLFGRVFDQDGDIDEAVAFVYRAPKSYTGENVVELCCHGGIYLVKRTLRACLDAGARLASSGEFTKRALLNGKMSLTQAEAVADLISAQGQHSAQAALQARDGAVYQKIHSVVDKLLRVSSALAAWIDYPDEDIEEVSDQNLKDSIAEISQELDKILSDYDNGKVFREGISTVIVGRPNVGKSTLMNLLAGQQKSIVTQIPGTTRDVVEDTIRIGDVLLQVADTAGLRATNDPVEQIGVQLAHKKLESSYLILAVFDSSDVLTEEDCKLIDTIKDRPVIAIINKSDLQRQIDVDYIRDKLGRVVEISANTGFGFKELADEILDLLQISNVDSSAGVIANERQRLCVSEASQTIHQAEDALLSGETLDAVNVCIDSAIDSLLILTGEKASDAVIDQVFERFCVGK